MYKFYNNINNLSANWKNNFDEKNLFAMEAINCAKKKSLLEREYQLFVT